ncbi:hypothetical protein PC113_g3435 [Phytophthora cactorum]|uniref:AP complex mu/sigma subunit domain-containing protein n=4 Tax=Peronosporaceae TaxID=4777 RepID=A0A8T0ZUP8_9STRA|nr:hypothetical protein PC112_g8847 [Phytophthora cactorum]KAG2865738.1 hypothetical protein PC113_g3435 [Phytophthora cactorum]
MIKFVLMVNKQGQTRLAQYYDFLSIQERVALEAEIIRKCLGRNESQCSFVEYRGYKVIYRRYASLFFIVGVKDDDSENELGILEFIHALVETMDKYFESVCELDIMFNLEKAHFILDEMVMNGYIVETNKISILKPIHLMEKASCLRTVYSHSRGERIHVLFSCFCGCFRSPSWLLVSGFRFTPTQQVNVSAVARLVEFKCRPIRDGSECSAWTTVEDSWAGADIPARVAPAGRIEATTELPPKRPVSIGLRDGLIDSAKCSICNKIFSTRHGTSSMMRHAKRHNEFPNGTPIGKKGKKNANGAAANGVAAGKKAATQKKDTIVMPIDEQAGMKRQRMRNLSSALIEWIALNR